MNNYDFTIPRRQSYVAIIQIVFKTVNRIFRQLWPILLIAIVKTGSKRGDYLLYALIVFACISMIISIINYFYTIYYTDEDELIHESGIIGKKKVSMRFDRIQTIDIEQNIIHRIFDVVKLKIDTAGSSKEEISIDAIQRAEAEALRLYLMKNKAELKNEEIEEDTSLRQEYHSSDKVILEMSPVDLLKAGLVENHLQTLGLVIAGAFWIVSQLDEFGLDFPDYDDAVSFAMVAVRLIGYIIFIGIILLILISLVRMVIINYNLSFLRTTNGFKVSKGLFTRRSTSAKDNKIQMISWGDNLLQKLFSISDLILNQAGSKEISKEKGIQIPGLSMSKIKYVVNELYGEQNIDRIKMHQVHTSWLYRKIFFSILFYFCIIALALTIRIFNQNIMTLLPLAVGIVGMIFTPINNWLAYRKLCYGHNEELLRVNGGKYGDKGTLSPMYKTQVVTLKQSPFQRKRSLHSMVIHNAAGKIILPYIPSESAFNLTNYILKIVESDRRNWM